MRHVHLPAARACSGRTASGTGQVNVEGTGLGLGLGLGLGFSDRASSFIQARSLMVGPGGRWYVNTTSPSPANWLCEAEKDNRGGRVKRGF